MKQIPTVKFDTSRLSYTVLADLEKAIRDLPEVNEQNFDDFYDLALRSLAAGGDLHKLSTGIAAMNIDGMTSQRSAQISNHLWFRAREMMQRDQADKLGIDRARWMYCNAPCMANPKAPTTEDLRRDSAHKAADGRIYVIAEGLVVDGKRTWPGHEDGCRCMSRTLVPGFEE
jgi:hypothetical protein